MTVNELRQLYLDFMAEKGHAIIPSSPLVPENDPTTLFTGSGMQPMVPYLLGEPHQLGAKIVDSQKCFRSQDIEEVGDNRHTTFFEMLGNWSLGDYFKEEQLAWMFEFLTDRVGLDPHKLFVTVFRGLPDQNIPRDDESVAIWQKQFQTKGIEARAVDHAEQKGMDDGRIFFYDATKNWWSRVGVPDNMPVGEPGGPDSEIFYDFGADRQLHESSQWADQPCHVNCDCGRFLEIGNNVFMQYVRTDSGFEPLPANNVDFGGGLERMLAAQADEPDVFLSDAYREIIGLIETLVGKSYQDEHKAAMRVIADHLKAAVFLIKDGVIPANKQQGYYLRRLIRRSIVKLYQLNDQVNPTDLTSIVSRSILKAYDGVYFQAEKDGKEVETLLHQEADKFAQSLAKGLRFFEKQESLTGKVAFDLYQTYGFPLEITLELSQQKGQEVNVDEFQREFTDHQNLSRTASTGMFKGGLVDQSEQTLKYHTATHLLHAALRKILGNHVQQKGSNITGERLRFDFSHPGALTEDEKQQVERQINDWIHMDLPVSSQVMAKQTALDSGAIAFFIEKYPDQVTVYTIGDEEAPPSHKASDGRGWVSKELCGGPHVTHTGEIGQIKIQKEQAVSAGVRRIYLE